MSNERRLTTQQLIEKIEKLAKSRIASEEVVSLEQFRDAKKKMDPKTLLIIEDDLEIQNLYKRIFEGKGFILRLASDATALAQVLDDSACDLVIIDIGLPWIDGLELAAMLKEHRLLKHIPFVFVSGSTDEKDLNRAFDVGAADFIKKPIDLIKLQNTVETLLKLND